MLDKTTVIFHNWYYFHMLSMTGFGRSVYEAPFGRLIFELQSINRKHLEIDFLLPKELLGFQTEVHQWIRSSISRGALTVRIKLTPNQNWKQSLPDPAQLKQLYQAWCSIVQESGLNPQTITLPFLLSHLSSSSLEELDEQMVKTALRTGIDLSLEELLIMKAREGEAILQDVVMRMGTLEAHLQEIRFLAPNVVERQHKKLRARLEEAFTSTQNLDERLLREVAIFADRVDISEELSRLSSHFEQFRTFLKETGPKGKTLEFVVQEVGRELNTIGSKANDAKISSLVIQSKSELEKIREQLQNIE